MNKVQLGFNGPQQSPTIRSPWQPILSQDFKQPEMPFYCLLQMCHASPIGVGACMYQFVSVFKEGLRVGYEYMWGGNRPATETKARLIRVPGRRPTAMLWNGDIWSQSDLSRSVSIAKLVPLHKRWALSLYFLLRSIHPRGQVNFSMPPYFKKEEERRRRGRSGHPSSTVGRCKRTVESAGGAMLNEK